jgi:hypothetical protein
VARVREVRLTLGNGAGHGRLGLYRAELVGPFEWRGWVDRYGQRKDGAWPHKVRSDADLIEADRQERRRLERVTRVAERDHYQAWAKGPQRRATGYFLVEQVDGRWWFIAPNGRLFFATGINVIWPGIHGPIDGQTQAAYEWLPPREGLLAKAWNEEGVSFHVVNQIRKWGEDYEARAHERAIRRQLFWGVHFARQLVGLGALTRRPAAAATALCDVRTERRAPDPYPPDAGPPPHQDDP